MAGAACRAGTPPLLTLLLTAALVAAAVTSTSASVTSTLHHEVVAGAYFSLPLPSAQTEQTALRLDLFPRPARPWLRLVPPAASSASSSSPAVLEGVPTDAELGEHTLRLVPADGTGEPGVELRLTVVALHSAAAQASSPGQSCFNFVLSTTVDAQPSPSPDSPASLEAALAVVAAAAETMSLPPESMHVLAARLQPAPAPGVVRTLVRWQLLCSALAANDGADATRQRLETTLASALHAAIRRHLPAATDAATAVGAITPPLPSRPRMRPPGAGAQHPRPSPAGSHSPDRPDMPAVVPVHNAFVRGTGGAERIGHLSNAGMPELRPLPHQRLRRAVSSNMATVGPTATATASATATPGASSSVVASVTPTPTVLPPFCVYTAPDVVFLLDGANSTGAAEYAALADLAAAIIEAIPVGPDPADDIRFVPPPQKKRICMYIPFQHPSSLQGLCHHPRVQPELAV